MIRILDIAQKDITQLLRERETFMFLLLMPVLFTLLFGYAFGGFGGGESDSRLPVGYLDQDQSWLSRELGGLLATSEIIRLDQDPTRSVSDLERLVAEKKLAAALIVPARYGRNSLAGRPAKLRLIADTATTAGTSIQADILAAANRLDSAVRTATILQQVTENQVPFDYAFEQALSAWEKPPIAVAETTSTAVRKSGGRAESLAHASPGMMLQFAIAGLLTAAQVIVTERKSRALQRLLTTATRRVHILLGHYAAMFSLIFGQFLLLMLFGWLALRVDYVREMGATLLVACSAALCIAALGLLIGVVARNEDQAVIFALIPMFILSGLGGAWVPLEVTGETFRAVGHVSPVAWAMDGFKNVIIRGLGLDSVLLPAAVLVGYAGLFFLLATWRFWRSEER